MKKVMLFASAVAVVAAFAVPASASAAMFFHSGKAIAAGGEIETVAGPAEFDGGIKCATLTITLRITTEDADVTNLACAGGETFGLLKTIGCNLTSPTAPVGTTFPWTVDVVSASSFQITGVNIDNPMGPGCPLGSNITATGNNVFAAPNGTKIKTLTLSGTVSTPAGNEAVHGTLTAAHPETFEIK